jgi:exodeoxyribonuclease X
MDSLHHADTAETLRVIDLETTGQNFTNGGVVEIGWQDLQPDDTGIWQLTEGGALLVDPRQPISPETSAIHHITDEDVVGAPLWHDAAARILRPARPHRFVALAAHRAAFEQRWCTPAFTGGTAWICTYKCALRVWPDSPTAPIRGCATGGGRKGCIGPPACPPIAPDPMPM